MDEQSKREAYLTDLSDEQYAKIEAHFFPRVNRTEAGNENIPIGSFSALGTNGQEAAA